jgi:hypothetical protein
VCLHVEASYEEHAWTPPCGIGFWQSPLADQVYPRQFITGCAATFAHVGNPLTFSCSQPPEKPQWILKTVAVGYFVEGSDHIVVASKYGSDQHPTWYLNLRAYPQSTLRSTSRSTRMSGHWWPSQLRPPNARICWRAW